MALVLLLLFTIIATGHLNLIDSGTFLGLFIPASAGVLGSFALYKKRQRDERRRLRKAIKSELEGMEFFKNWPESVGKTVPKYDVLATTLYERNADSLGILSDEENERIVEFYTRAKVVQGIIGRNWEKSVRVQASATGTDTNKRDREKGIRKQLDRLALSRERALLTLESKLNESALTLGLIEENEILPSHHPLIQRNLILCLEYGLLEIEDDENALFCVTARGEQYFQGTYPSTNLEKEDDLMDRDQSRLQDFIDTARSIVSKPD